MSETAVRPASGRVAILGWSLISMIGGIATLVSVALVAILVFVLDVFVLAKGPIKTEYLTILRLKGSWSVPSDGQGGYTYEVRNQRGSIVDAQLPWAAEPGSHVRIRHHNTKLLGLVVPSEAPVLCPPDVPCD